MFYVVILDVEAQTIDSTKVKVEKLFNLKKTTKRNTQGAAVFNNLLFQCHDTNDIIDIYDLQTNEHLQSIKLEGDSITHCNNVDFGREYYSESDRFPLLYLQVREKYHKTLVFRIVEEDSIMRLDKVQTLQFEPLNWCTTTIDARKRKMYVLRLGKEINYLYRFNLPKVSEGDLTFHISNASKTIEIPKVKQNQDATIHRRFLYRIYGFKDQGVLGVVNLKEGKLVGLMDLTKYGMTSEPEGIIYYNHGLIITFLNKEVYRITFEKGAF